VVDGCGVTAALDALRLGRPMIVVDRSGEGELVLAAEHATDRSIAFLVRHTSGYLCVAAPAERWELLGVPRMPGCDVRRGTPYRVAVDAREGHTTGISARERAHTIRLIADPRTQPEDLIRPGHVVTEQARPGGVLEHGGYGEATVDLMRLAGLHPAGVRGHLVRADGFTADNTDVRAFAHAHDLAWVTVDELVAYRRRQVTPLVAGKAHALPAAC